MSATITLTRTHRRENDEALSGSEAFEVEGFPGFSQGISANTEEDLAWGAIKAMQLEALTMRCDQDVDAQFLGVRYNVLALVAVAGVAPAEITFTGDLTDIVFPGDILRLEGTAANDGLYQVQDEYGAYPLRDAAAVTFAAGDTTILLANGHVLAAAGAVGTFARVASVQEFAISYPIATADAGPPGVITYAGDLSDMFEAGDYLIIDRSTDTPPGKNGLYEIATVATDGPPVTTTTITLVAGVTLQDATNDGEFRRVIPSFKMIANVPLLWSEKGGTNNPLQSQVLFTGVQGDVAVLAINNETATAATFEVRAGTNPILP